MFSLSSLLTSILTCALFEAINFDLTYFLISVAQCTGLKTTWTNMVTTSKFPVFVDTVVSLSCNAGYELKGSNQVTCIQNTAYHFIDDVPLCSEFYSDRVSLFR